jgi:hypothetical protein
MRGKDRMDLNFDNTMLAFCVAAIILMIFYMISKGANDDEVIYQQPDPDMLEKMEEQTNDIYNQRIQLVIDSINVLWNSMLIEQWLQCDQTTPKDSIQTNSVIFSEDVICVYSTYIPRSLKIICQLSWEKQKMYVRVEQPISVGTIEVEREVKIKAGVISIMQAEDIAEEYFDSIMELTNSAKKDEAEPEQEVESEN